MQERRVLWLRNCIGTSLLYTEPLWNCGVGERYCGEGEECVEAKGPGEVYL